MSQNKPDTERPAPDRCDAVIIGAGQAGVPLAQALTDSGRQVVLIEAEHVGGTCVNEGCTPTKTMIASARVAHLARRSDEYGVQDGQVQVDFAAVQARKDSVVEQFRSGSRDGLEQAGVELVMGRARFIGPHTVQATLPDGSRRAFEAPLVFINTGARPTWPNLPGLRDVGAVDSTGLLALRELPEHLLILGGGYIGLEFGQAFARFGSRVTVIERGERLASHEDPDVAAALTDVLCDEGVAVLCGREVVWTRRSDSGVDVLVRDPQGEQILSGSHLLVATGRTPNTDDLGLDVAGVDVDERGHVRVDDDLRTNVEGVYALGDVKGGPAFTHVAYDDFRIVRDALLHGQRRSWHNRLIPYTVFTDPQLARVGLDEMQAREQGLRVRVYTLPMSKVARAIETGETSGLMKAVVDDETDQILGATVLGAEGGETLSVLQVAMQGNLTASDLRDGVFSHPTWTESLNNLFMGTPVLHTPKSAADERPGTG
ncbi:mercuric reductase [Deinococcus humi]|uniref:Pyruvate/2-oxoglutarate dehydrogenase complex dihydrolipoamide dehydrogenase (E3) component n=1 Tax=Deinococcus humi TaxID=662880 RepID=A0A7W8JUJ0_9DEIO|nr:mercuric reductase [Deinococcus humi]MBB5363424.1 pyruvate/2-oxoglutarate dehydrogenase complex dihydrolipoamide dehydrogenase (E3) component [Deinococcus humi]GGO26594.1 mercuric reductase [Deinococcus humi]